MKTIQIPTRWSTEQADAAIQLIESILDALWHQYPEPPDEYYYDDLAHNDSESRLLNDPQQGLDANRYGDDDIPF